MSELHLISHHLCPYVQRAVIVLDEKNIAHRRTYIDLADKPAWFAALSPLGRVPVLQAEDAVVFESQVIAEYLDEITPGSLHPLDPLSKARHRSWIEFGSETLNAIGALYNAKTAESFEEKRLALRDKFSRMEREIEGPYFAGDVFHMIDGVWGTIFRYLDVFDQIGDFGLTKDLPKTSAWRARVAGRPSVAHAAPAGYPGRLLQFLAARDAYIASMVRRAA
ncbi:MAG: glutathione S-transferase family protein [Rhodospirillales bacterium]|nr:glutathione S-transferase family protein [Rhodospirillales bacterium]MBO6785821.1 glutathione S-transferase family protein [Rhodospirillales bacterium]